MREWAASIKRCWGTEVEESRGAMEESCCEWVEQVEEFGKDGGGGGGGGGVPVVCEWRASSARMCGLVRTEKALLWSAPVAGGSAANSTVANTRPCRRSGGRVAKGGGASEFEQNSCGGGKWVKCS